METIIKYLKFIPVKMISLLCIIFPPLLALAIPDFDCDMESMTIYVLLACVEFILIPAAGVGILRIAASVLLLVAIILLSVFKQCVEWQLLCLMVFLLVFLLFKSRSGTDTEGLVGGLFVLGFFSVSALIMSIAGRIVLYLLMASACVLYAVMVISVVSENLKIPSQEELSKAAQLAMLESDKEEMMLLLARVEAVMTSEKPFLSETYCLMDMASSVYTNKTYLSKTINELTGKNFRQYINAYRVEYAVRLMHENNKLRVSELSELSGFHSPVTFGMAFKLIMGETPGEYLQKLKAGLE